MPRLGGCDFHQAIGAYLAPKIKTETFQKSFCQRLQLLTVTCHLAGIGHQPGLQSMLGRD